MFNIVNTVVYNIIIRYASNSYKCNVGVSPMVLCVFVILPHTTFITTASVSTNVYNGTVCKFHVINTYEKTFFVLHSKYKFSFLNRKCKYKKEMI